MCRSMGSRRGDMRAADAAQRVALREAVRCRAGAQLAKTVSGVPALRSGMKNAAARPGHGMRVSALAATERRCAGQAKQIEFASRRRLRVADAEGQVEIRRG